jgi:hypothetical protein
MPELCFIGEKDLMREISSTYVKAGESCAGLWED